MCPIETPESPEHRPLSRSLATRGRINAFRLRKGRPYRRAVKGKVSDDVDYPTADEEERYVIAQANAPLKDDGHFAEDRVLVRREGWRGRLRHARGGRPMDTSQPRQMCPSRPR